MNQAQLKRYFLDNMPSYIEDVIPNQIHQAWIRISICFLGLIYTEIHATYLTNYYNLLTATAIAYIAFQIFTITSIKKHPLSFARMIIYPIFDVIFLSFALMVDGGQFSPLYLFYFLAIMGNGMRFGNYSLMYSQTLALIAFPSVCFYLFTIHQAPIDIPVFILQILTLIVLPLYTQRANTHANNAAHAQKDAQSLAFQLLDKSPIAAFTFQYNDQKETCINYVNQALQDTSPLPLEALIGYPVQELFLTQDMTELSNACESILSNHEQHPAFYIRAQGKTSTLQLLGNVRSFHFNQTLIGICFLTDITQQQKSILKMQQNMQEGYMSTLVAGIVHDFRNVLTTIMGTAEMIQFTSIKQETNDHLELIIQASEQGSRMVKDLLTLGKASHSEETNIENDILPSLKSMVNLLRIQLPQSIPLSLQTPKILPSIQINLTQLEQILMNLINNAADASPDGGAIDVTIDIGMQDKQGEPSIPAIIIQVADHGTGIAASDLDQVTQAFWTSKKDMGGTGLGLAMVQRIARQHNGSFHIDSTLGKGTCITLTFPIIESILVKSIKKETDILPLLRSEDTQESSKVWRVLLVDDNPDVLHVHQQMLERMGHHITLAHTGKEALSQFTQNPEDFDCIVTDFLMPGMDGIDLCQHIRQQNSDIPLLMITAFAESNKLQHIEDLNIKMLFKPISFQCFKQKMAMIKNLIP